MYDRVSKKHCLLIYLLKLNDVVGGWDSSFNLYLLVLENIYVFFYFF